jgi:hypothetical protein
VGEANERSRPCLGCIVLAIVLGCGAALLFDASGRARRHLGVPLRAPLRLQAGAAVEISFRVRARGRHYVELAFARGGVPPALAGVWSARGDPEAFERIAVHWSVATPTTVSAEGRKPESMETGPGRTGHTIDAVEVVLGSFDADEDIPYTLRAEVDETLGDGSATPDLDVALDSRFAKAFLVAAALDRLLAIGLAVMAALALCAAAILRR